MKVKLTGDDKKPPGMEPKSPRLTESSSTTSPQTPDCQEPTIPTHITGAEELHHAEITIEIESMINYMRRGDKDDLASVSFQSSF